MVSAIPRVSAPHDFKKKSVGKLGTISIINSRILSMTTAATTTCNSNILDVLNSKMNENK
jgi:hypothetical protein